MIGLEFGFGAVEGELWRLLFAMTRIGAALLAAPFFGAANVPVQLRVAIAGAIIPDGTLTWQSARGSVVLPVFGLIGCR